MLEPADTPAHPAARVRRPLLTSAWVFVLVLVVVGFGLLASRPAAPDTPDVLGADVASAKRAIEALAAPGPQAGALEHIPADFAEVTGVRVGKATALDGSVRAVHVGGGCSTPWGEDATRWNYSVPCMAHDLGYDLLRYAEKKGQPLGQPVRRALDERLSADMHATCRINPAGSVGTCDAVASLFSTALLVNSWHQRWGPPIGEPIVPMLAGVAAIGVLLMFRLRGWLRARRLPVLAGAPSRAPPDRAARADGSWAVLGVASLVALTLGESGIALASWAGADPSWLWPLSWLAQLAFVFFFAGGQANAAGWQEVRGGGGRYRQYLAHRAGWLLRPAVVFAVVAFAVPMALELIGVPPSTTTTVMRIALHPLWLLAVYLLTVAATPVMLALHRRTPYCTLLGLGALIGIAELSASWVGSPLPRYLGALGVALLAQQLAIAKAGHRVNRWVAALCVMGGLVTLLTLRWSGQLPEVLLGSPGTAPVLAAPALPVLLLGMVQLGLLALLRRPLARAARYSWVARCTGFCLRAPMSLYLGFLTAMLLLVAAVYLPRTLGNGLAWLAQPRSLLALALPAAPALLVFWWFERHNGAGSIPLPQPQPGLGRLEVLLGRAAVVLGVGYALIGMFGLAVAGFGGVAGDATLLGISLEPIQSLVRLLLGVCMLHTVRTGSSAAPGTWMLAGLACVPPLLAATSGEVVDSLAVVVHGGTALFAIAASVATVAARGRAGGQRPESTLANS